MKLQYSFFITFYLVFWTNICNCLSLRKSVGTSPEEGKSIDASKNDSDLMNAGVVPKNN